MRTLEQRRAANALARVKHFKRRHDSFKKSYRSYVDRLSPAIVMNGLGQALATELAAAGDNPDKDNLKAHKDLFESLSGWLCDPSDGVYRGAADLMEAIMGNNENAYLRAQAEALAWLNWHKKFCRAEFPRGEIEGE